MTQRIYLDNAATTRMLPEAAAAMEPCFSELYGNPSSLHSFGREAKKALEEAREQIAGVLHASGQEIFFTSGGSEGDNLLLRGAVLASKKGRHVITSPIEHPAVLNTLRELERRGEISLSFLAVNREGLVDPEELKKLLRQDTCLVSLMIANNEMGAIEPAEKAGALCREAGVLFHTDAVQALGHIPVDVQRLNADLLTFTAHKFHGPRGVGGVYIRKGVSLAPTLTGGEQESGRRAGTENVAGVLGMAAALKTVTADKEAPLRIIRLRDRLIEGVLASVPQARLNGPRYLRLPDNAHFTVPGVSSEALLALLDLNGVAASAGSACTAGSYEPSHVLGAMGLLRKEKEAALRLTLSRFTTEQEVEKVLTLLPELVQKLRR